MSRSDVKVWTLLTEGGRQIGFGPAPGNVIASEDLMAAFGVSEAWVDATLGQVEGAERWVNRVRPSRRGWINVGEWHSGTDPGKR